MIGSSNSKGIRFAGAYDRLIPEEGMGSCDVSVDIVPRGQEQIIACGGPPPSRLDRGGPRGDNGGCGWSDDGHVALSPDEC